LPTKNTTLPDRLADAVGFKKKKKWDGLLGKIGKVLKPKASIKYALSGKSSFFFCQK